MAHRLYWSLLVASSNHNEGVFAMRMQQFRVSGNAIQYHNADPDPVPQPQPLPTDDHPHDGSTVSDQ